MGGFIENLQNKPTSNAVFSIPSTAYHIKLKILALSWFVSYLTFCLFCYLYFDNLLSIQITRITVKFYGANICSRIVKQLKQ